MLLSCWFLPRCRLANAPLRGLLSGLLSSLVQYVPPQFEYVSLVAGCLILVDGHHSHFCRLDAARQLLGMTLYPRSRVLPAQCKPVRGREYS